MKIFEIFAFLFKQCFFCPLHFLSNLVNISVFSNIVIRLFSFFLHIEISSLIQFLSFQRNLVMSRSRRNCLYCLSLTGSSTLMFRIVFDCNIAIVKFWPKETPISGYPFIAFIPFVHDRFTVTDLAFHYTS